jgi:hypothetical protein
MEEGYAYRVIDAADATAIGACSAPCVRFGAYKAARNDGFAGPGATYPELDARTGV